MDLNIILGQNVEAVIDAHSTINGSIIPDTATVELTSNDPTVATVSATVPVPPGGTDQIVLDVTVLAVGATDIHVKVTTTDGVFEDTATLTVAPTPIPGLARVSLTLRVKA